MSVISHRHHFLHVVFSYAYFENLLLIEATPSTLNQLRTIMQKLILAHSILSCTLDLFTPYIRFASDTLDFVGAGGRVQYWEV